MRDGEKDERLSEDLNDPPQEMQRRPVHAQRLPRSLVHVLQNGKQHEQHRRGCELDAHDLKDGVVPGKKFARRVEAGEKQERRRRKQDFREQSREPTWFAYRSRCGLYRRCDFSSERKAHLRV